MNRKIKSYPDHLISKYPMAQYVFRWAAITHNTISNRWTFPGPAPPGPNWMETNVGDRRAKRASPPQESLNIPLQMLVGEWLLKLLTSWLGVSQWPVAYTGNRILKLVIYIYVLGPLRGLLNPLSPGVLDPGNYRGGPLVSMLTHI